MWGVRGRVCVHVNIIRRTNISLAQQNEIPSSDVWTVNLPAPCVLGLTSSVKDAKVRRITVHIRD